MYTFNFAVIARSQTVKENERFINKRMQSSNTVVLKPVSGSNWEKGLLRKSGFLWKTGSNCKEFLNRWCVLMRSEHNIDDASFAYYLDRKSGTPRGRIMLRDVSFVRAISSVPAKTKLPTSDANTEFALFEVAVNTRKGRVFLFAAKCVAEQRIWISIISQAIAWKNIEPPKGMEIRFNYVIVRSASK